MNLFNYCFQGLFILYATGYLGVEPGVLGLALGAGAIGGVLGAVVAAPLGRRIGIGRAYIVGPGPVPGARRSSSRSPAGPAVRRRSSCMLVRWPSSSAASA